MRKLLALFLVLASPLMAFEGNAVDSAFQLKGSHDSYAYYYLNYQQILSGKSGDYYSPVLWNPDLSKEGDDVFLDSEDYHDIILEDKGHYLVTYSVTIDNSENDDYYRFALLVNGHIVEGSIYGTTTSEIDSTVQLFGQAVFRTHHHCSVLQLVNDSDDFVSIIPISGPSGESDSVSVSIFIQKLK